MSLLALKKILMLNLLESSENYFLKNVERKILLKDKFKSKRKELSKEDIQCYKCKEYGHVATECTNKRKYFKK